MFSAREGVLVIGHRGGAGAAPENTLEAIRHGIEAGADAIEFDIHATADDRIVLFHDDTLERTTDGQGVVETHTLEQLQGLDAGHGFTADLGGSFPFRGNGVRIPTIDAAAERSSFPASTGTRWHRSGASAS